MGKRVAQTVEILALVMENDIYSLAVKSLATQRLRNVSFGSPASNQNQRATCLATEAMNLELHQNALEIYDSAHFHISIAHM